MLDIDTLCEELSEENPDAIRFTDLDSAIIGRGRQWANLPVLVYSAKRILAALQASGMDAEDALDWYGHNIECLAIGDGTPFIVDDLGECYEDIHVSQDA